MGEAFALGFHLRRESEHVFNRRAVLALEVLDEVEPLFHRVQPLWVEFNGLAVGGQIARQIAELLAQRLRLVAQRG